MMMRARTITRQPIARGFTLIELLLAILILGIGVISIAAVFPAAIAQQQRSVDDVLGAVVAENALAIIRSKISADDFGTFALYVEGCGALPAVPPEFGDLATVAGDWPWIRPAFDTVTGDLDVFSFNRSGDMYNENDEGRSPLDTGIPYNYFRFGCPSPTNIPERLIKSYECQYPLGTGAVTDRPEYHWTCMFRRFQGRVLVAIFVYRVTGEGGSSSNDYVPAFLLPKLVGTHPTLPACSQMPSIPAGDYIVPGTDPGDPFDPVCQDWQAPGQWWLDSDNRIHRVLEGREESDQGPVALRDRVALLPTWPDPLSPTGRSPIPAYRYSEFVERIWYMPTEITDASGRIFRITPVYVTVREL